MKSFHRLLTLSAAALFLSLFTLPAQAESWKEVANLEAKGGAKEVTVNKKIARFRIICMEGEVTINTIAVREGGKHTSVTVARKLSKGEEHKVELGERKMVTGLRISDGSGGRYIIKVF